MNKAFNSFPGWNQLSRMKTVFTVIGVAAVLQFLVCKSVSYSDRSFWVLTVVGFVGWIVLGLNAPNGFMAFCGSVASGVPSISYSMIGYGPLEMGGFVHAFSFGVYGFVSYKIIQYFKREKPATT